MYLLSAKFKAQMTCTITLPPSPADQGGAFDTPEGKCPPDRGSSDCVRDSSARMAASQPQLGSNYFAQYPFKDSETTAGAIAIAGLRSPAIGTPPLTPDYGSDCSSSAGSNHSGSEVEQDALDFLMTVFPEDGLKALPYSKKVAISSAGLASSFDGVTMSIPGQPKTLYVDGKNAASVSLRESIVALLDLADERLECSALVIVLERSSPSLGELLHSLMYVGGSVVTKAPFAVDPAFVLVGMEI